MLPRKIYLASSWRNPLQPQAVKMLRDAGHEVYDFRNPAPCKKGFSWSDISKNWQAWTLEEFIEGLQHNIAQIGYSYDKAGLDWCDTCVLLLPCGKSAHLEAGYAIGKAKQTLIVLHDFRFEPELMYLLAGSPSHIVPGLDHMLEGLDLLPPPRIVPPKDAEKLLPCPYCGSNRPYLRGTGIAIFAWCPDCCRAGNDTLEARQAIKVWNELVRPLWWSRQTPTEPGFYWWRQDRDNSKVAHVFWGARLHSANKVLFAEFTDEEDVVHDVTGLVGEWAGPIPMPMEKKA